MMYFFNDAEEERFGVKIPFICSRLVQDVPGEVWDFINSYTDLRLTMEQASVERALVEKTHDDFSTTASYLLTVKDCKDLTYIDDPMAMEAYEDLIITLEEVRVILEEKQIEKQEIFNHVGAMRRFIRLSS